MKTCSKCKIEKPLDSFSRNGIKRRSHCKPCMLEYKRANNDVIRNKYREWVKANADDVASKKRAYRQENKDKIHAARRIYEDKNKEIIAEKRRQYYEANKERIAEYSKARYPLLREYHRINNKAWHERNREHRDAYIREYRQNNKVAKAKSERRRISSKLKATPKWADLDAIKAIYDLADEIGGVHVDHIVPLRSKLVCGLHVHHNLQILSPKENMAKGNWWWPDMP